MSWRVLITAHRFDLTPQPQEELLAHGGQSIPAVFRPRADRLQPAELMEQLRGIDGIILGQCAMTREVIQAADRLRVIARRGVGYDNVDVQAATERGILVTTTPGTLDNAVADHVFALMLAVARTIPRGHQSVVDGRWHSAMGFELWRKTLGIVGFGRIGKQVARRAQGFEMRTLAYDVVRREDQAGRLGVTYVPLDELLRSSDLVSVNVPLSPATRHLIGAAQLELMKPSAILVNTARGGVIDEAALVAALRAGSIRGAGLDTFDGEPNVSAALRELDTVVLSPHTAGRTEEAIAEANLMAAQCVASVMRGEQPPAEAVVNPQAWKKPQ